MVKKQRGKNYGSGRGGSIRSLGQWTLVIGSLGQWSLINYEL